MAKATPPRDDVVIADLLARRAAENPDKIFAVFDNEELSYACAAELVWATAHGFSALGVGQGQCVASWLPTGKHALLAWFGLNALGAVYAPINLAFRGRILEHALGIAEAEILVVHSDLLSRLDELDLPHLKTLVIVGETSAAPSRFRTVGWDSLARHGPRPVLAVPTEAWDDMALLYTSGTTGLSKAVRCSYLHHHTFSEAMVWPDVGPDDRHFVCLPMFHVSGTIPTYTMLQRNGSLAFAAAFDTKTFWDDVRRFNITSTMLMAAMGNFLNKQPPTPNDAENPLRVAYMAPLLEDLESFSKRFGVALFTAYGMTEIPGVTRTELNPKDWRQCGRLVDPKHYELRIVDDHDQEVPVGTVGEAMVRHSRPWSLNSGYKGMPDATATAWRNGWFHTGDALCCDEDGNFYYVDRVKDALRRRGENISSMEVENEILAHPAVEQAAVVAVASDVQEDEIKAVITLKAGVTVSCEDLISFLIPRLPYYMVPRYIEFLDELPKTPTHKVMKVELRARGLTPNTWDREKAGIKLKREKLKVIES